MKTLDKDTAIKKISEMSKEQVSKVLIFMAGIEAEHHIAETEMQKGQASKERGMT